MWRKFQCMTQPKPYHDVVLVGLDLTRWITMSAKERVRNGPVCFE